MLSMRSTLALHAILANLAATVRVSSSFREPIFPRWYASSPRRMYARSRRI